MKRIRRTKILVRRCEVVGRVEEPLPATVICPDCGRVFEPGPMTGLLPAACPEPDVAAYSVETDDDES